MHSYRELDTTDKHGRKAFQCEKCRKMFYAHQHELPIYHQCGGPGTELRKIFRRIGIAANNKCRCDVRSNLMDFWGVTGCREHREEIITWLVDATNDLPKISWLPQWSKRAAAAWLVDEAIKRASLP